MSDPRYPIVKFQYDGPHSEAGIRELIDRIAEQPTKLWNTVRGLSDDRLNSPYREGGWTRLQVIHHLADSHLNAYIRCRLALTEDNPTIKPYEEKLWAELPDARSGPPEHSLVLFEALTARWVLLLRSLSHEDFARPLMHPETGPTTLNRIVALYAWHGHHHIAHLTL